MTEWRPTSQLVDELYLQMMLLSDDARLTFERLSADQTLSPEARVAVAIEGLRVTTRLMHLTAWALEQKAAASGELEWSDLSEWVATGVPPQDSPALPDAASAIIRATEDLWGRVVRLQPGPADGDGARGLLKRLRSEL